MLLGMSLAIGAATWIACASVAAAAAGVNEPSGSLALVTVGSGAGDAIPDSGEMATLRKQASAPRQVRLVGSFGTKELSRALLDSVGISSAEWAERAHRRPALLLTPNASRPAIPAPIPWSEISELQTGRSRPGVGALVGFATGAVAAVGIFHIEALNEGEAWRNLGIGMATLTTSTILGALIGSTHGWRTVYRNPVPGKSS